MGLFVGLLTLPLAPVRCVVRIAERRQVRGDALTERLAASQAHPAEEETDG
jgi:hypothetical protein